MSATTSIFGRVFVAVCANTLQPRLIAAAMAAAVAVAAPGGAHADEYLSGNVSTPMGVSDGGSRSDLDAGKVAGGAIGAIGAGVLASAFGANKYFTAAAAVLGGIGGVKVVEQGRESAPGRALPGVVVPSTGQEIEPRGLEGAVGLERSLIFPASIGRPGLPRMRQESVRAYDDLAIQAAAYRLLTQSSYGEYLAAREDLALHPREIEASQRMIAAKRALDNDIAGLNVSLASYSRATQILRRNYPGNDFGASQALAASLSAPAQMRAQAVEPDRPIYPFAEAMAMQIRNGEVPRVTVAAPGYATGDDRLRSAIVGQYGTLDLQQSGRTSRLSPDSTLDALNLRSRMR